MTSSILGIARLAPCAPETRGAQSARLAGWLGLVLLLLAVAAVGCGESHAKQNTAKWGGMSKEEWLKQRAEKDKEKKAKEAEAAAKAKEEAAKRDAELKGRKTVHPQAVPAPIESRIAPSKVSAKPPASESQVEANSEVLPPPPMLPDAFADWQEGDLYIARMSGDLRLPAAVERYGRQTAGEPKAGEVLTSLLKPRVFAGFRDRLAGAAGEEAERPGEKTPPVLLIEAIAEALGANGTSTAWQTLGQMVSGGLSTEHDRTAALAALKSLVTHPCPESERLLFRIVTAAPEIRPTGQGGITAEELRQTALALLQGEATSRFRLVVAEYMVDPTTPQTQRDLFAPLVLGMHPNSFEAQAVLYESPVTDVARKLTIERYFPHYSSDALGCIFGDPGKQPLLEAHPEWPTRVASRLWTPKFCELVENRLALTAAMQDAAVLAVMASTLPCDAVRVPLLKTLEKHWEDGPKTLRDVGLATGVACEPGTLVLLKTVLRKSGGGGRTDSSRYASSAKATASQLVAARQRRTVQIENDWVNLVRDLSRAYCGQLSATAAARAEAIRKSGQSFSTFPPPGGLPLSLHSTDYIFAAQQLDWASELSKIPHAVPPDPLRVHYVRIEERTRLTRIQGFYRRQLKQCESRPIHQGVWLDSLATESGSGNKRSIDVFITAPMADSLRLPDDEQKLIVEILAIEIRDPSGE